MKYIFLPSPRQQIFRRFSIVNLTRIYYTIFVELERQLKICLTNFVFTNTINIRLYYIIEPNDRNWKLCDEIFGDKSVLYRPIYTYKQKPFNLSYEDKFVTKSKGIVHNFVHAHTTKCIIHIRSEWEAGSSNKSTWRDIRRKYDYKYSCSKLYAHPRIYHTSPFGREERVIIA